ncbi:hypothetical protein [Phytopseudomonas dryadis]|uniref:Uncharacterized protein n=1 Tax=Phytopseudomonas dryadis TaxID=2487520 RepID=A0A4Q9QUD5_9GAMM|nr:hypothetical protein [Pseudomonas dryadis]TBU86946.1 hypothetical protein DNK44_21770 [Pseudomonas dryadis]
MSTEETTCRQVGSRLDSKTANCRFDHTLTPNNRTDPVQLRLPPPQQGLAIYPLRYAVLRHAFPRAKFPMLDFSGYAELGDGYHLGVRELRPRTQLYLLYTENGTFKHKHYQVTDAVQFAEIVPPEDAGETTTSTDQQGNPVTDMPTVSSDVGFITAPLPTAEREIGDTAYLLTCDTPLTATVLGKLERNEGGLRTATTTEIRLKGGTRQPHVLGTEALKDVPALAEDGEQRLSLIDWSENQPQEMLGGETIHLVCQRRAQQPGQSQRLPPIAVALHDPVGVMSEFGHLTGSHVLDLQEWSDHEQVPRKVMVSQWIDELGQQKARSVELNTYNNDYIGSATQGASGGAANAARDQAYRAGLAARDKRLESARNDERKQFMATYEQKRQEFITAIDKTAAAAYAMYSAVELRHGAVMQLYDETDVESFICLRRAVTYSMTVLACDPQGRQVLEAMLPEAGPTGLMARAIKGFPDFADFVDVGLAVAQQGGLVAASLATDRIRQLAERVPPDDTSRYLSNIIAELVARKRLRTPEAFERSIYFRALQLLEGSLVGREPTDPKNAGKWLLELTNGKAVNGFRPSTLARHNNELISLYKSEPVQSHISEINRTVKELRESSNNWHGLKFSFGAYGIFLGTYNLHEVINKLGNDDGPVLVNSLSLASGLLATGSSVAVAGEAGHQGREAAARTRANAGAATQAQHRATRYGNWAIGMLAASAATTSFKELLLAANANSAGQATAHAAGSVLQAAAATTGGLHLMGRLSTQQHAGTLAQLSRTAMTSMGKRAAGTGVAAGVARAAFGIARLGSGPIGWTLLALELSYQTIRVWNDKNTEERKVTDWIARSIWGTGIHRNRIFSDETLSPFTPEEETKEFYRFFMEPHIETDVAVLRTLASVNIPAWGTINKIRHGSYLPADARTVTVALPGWKPQVSAYIITQHNEFRFTGIQKTLDDPDLVQLRKGVGVGYISYPTDTLGGNIEVKYWPNAFAEPDLVLEMEKT